MSLSSFLLKSTGTVDSGLDALFKTQPPPAPKPVPIASPTHPSDSEGLAKKRKLDEQKHDVHPKRRKSAPKHEANSSSESSPKIKGKAQASSDEEDDEENSDLEAAYLRSKEANEELDEDEDVSGEDSEVEDDDGADASNLVHESLTGKTKSKSKVKTKKQKYVPPDETPAHRDQRTIFIGNLTLEVAQKRPLQKQLQRHILSFVPTAKIESIRFRSVPFSSPSTTTASTASTTDDKHPHTKKPSQREHDRTRASSWRTTNDESTTPETKSTDKPYLTPNQKKKVLFLTNQFHTSGTTVHAYIVFAHPPAPSSTRDRPANLPPLPSVLDPCEAARQAVKNADGSEFEGRVIRVDFVGGGAKGVGKGRDKGRAEGEEGGEVIAEGEKAFKDADPKLTLFVGNLDLGSQEEDLRAFFESLMKTERGEPPSAGFTEDNNKNTLRRWVTRVRIIRDKDTQLGKGFGYVQFIDRECVDEILTLTPLQLKFAKRKLRVQRCKTLPGGTKLPSSVKSSLTSNPASTSMTKSTTKDSKSTSKQQQRVPPTPIIIPKGDPSLGTKIATLSKQERKVVKAADADRVARRLAKKKARMAMGTSKDRAGVGSGNNGEEGKKRVRERVKKGASGVAGGKGKKDLKDGKKKSRVRSEKNLEKRNAKK